MHCGVEVTESSTNKQQHHLREVSGLGAHEVLVVRDVLHVHALQVRRLWRTETKKQRVDLIVGVPILISLGAKLATLKTFDGWVARVTIVCIHVHECPSRHCHQEERRCGSKDGVRRDRPRVQERGLREVWNHIEHCERPEHHLSGQTCRCGRVQNQEGRLHPRCVCQ